MKKIIALFLILGAFYLQEVKADEPTLITNLSGTKIRAELKFKPQSLLDLKYLKLYSANSDTVYSILPPIIDVRGKAVVNIIRIPGFAGQCIEFDPLNIDNCLKKEPIGVVKDSVYIKNTRTGATFGEFSVQHDTASEVDLNDFIVNKDGLLTIDLTAAGLSAKDVTEVYFLANASDYYYNSPSEVPLKRTGIATHSFNTIAELGSTEPEHDYIYVTRPSLPLIQIKNLVYWFYAKNKVYFFYGR